MSGIKINSVIKHFDNDRIISRVLKAAHCSHEYFSEYNVQCLRDKLIKLENEDKTKLFDKQAITKIVKDYLIEMECHKAAILFKL